MDWAEGIRRAIDYIEAHLEEEIDPAAVARCAACSSFYFQRIFTALCGMTMGEYIRARRLTLAGSELACTGARVIDVALKYGYESPESFCRAFSCFHGVAPSEAKRMGSRLKSFSRLTVQIILKGGSIMDYRIEDKAAFDILARVETHCIDGEHQRKQAMRQGISSIKQRPAGTQAGNFGHVGRKSAKDFFLLYHVLARLYRGGRGPGDTFVAKICR